MEVPSALQAGTLERAAALAARERAADAFIRDFYAKFLLNTREDLERFFIRYFQAAWSTVKAKQLQVVDTMMDTISAQLAEMEEELADDLDAELVEAADEGHEYTLWLLFTGGVDTVDGRRLSPETARMLMAAGGIAGLSAAGRLHAWHENFQARTERWLRTSIARESNLDDTLRGVNQLGQTTRRRVQGLVKNELHRANLTGVTEAALTYENQLIGMVWLTRQDRLVCARCARLHGTLTTLKPIDDTHPACRCQVVPIPVAYQSRPMDFLTFLDARGGA